MSVVSHNIEVLWHRSRARAAVFSVGRAARVLAAEISRWNSAGIDADAFTNLSLRERIRLVKASLAERHRHINHCC